jgi:hypothetical protein
MDAKGGGKMRDSRPQRRRSLHVKQSKAYQLLLVTMIVIFMAVAAFVINSSLSPNRSMENSAVIQMIMERNSVRQSQGGQ